MTNIYEITKEEINGLTGEDYEKLIIEYYNVLGFKSTQTAKTNDYGVDVVVNMPSGLAAIQCKRQTSNVSIKAIQEVVAGSRKYKADILKVFTTAGFTGAANELAGMWAVQLIDGNAFWEMIQDLQEDKILLTGKHTLKSDMEQFYSSYQQREEMLKEYEKFLKESKTELNMVDNRLSEKMMYVEDRVEMILMANRDIKELKDNSISDINIAAQSLLKESDKVYKMMEIIDSKENITIQKPKSFFGKIIYSLLTK